MSFLNLTGMATYKKSVPRIFARPKFSDIECDAVKGGKIPATGGWVQLYASDGGAVLTPTRTTTDLGDLVRGRVRKILDMQLWKLELNFAQNSVQLMKDIMIIDPSDVSIASAGFDLTEARGMDITSLGVSFLIYDKEFDPSNETNVPAITCDSEAWMLTICAPADAAPLIKNNAQGTAKAGFDCLMSTSSGASSGKGGKIGAFTVLS
jgi:hypothetical protein